MEKLELNQMEDFIGGDGTEDWCNAIDGLGGYDFINSLDDELRDFVGGLYNFHCAY